MITPELERALEDREVLHVQKNDLDAKLYDTNQVLAVGSITKKKRSREGTKRIIKEVRLPKRVTYNLRNGETSCSVGNTEYGIYFSYPPEGLDPLISEALELLKQRGANLKNLETLRYEERNDLELYPELADFVKEIHHAFVCRKWERHELAIKDFLPTLAGHGNMHPLALFQPKVIWAYIIGTVFPFERKDVFDFEKGRKNLENRTAEYMDSSEGVSYNGNVVLIRPYGLDREDERDYTFIAAHFFNPVNYQLFLDGALSVENPLPSRRDWMFEVNYAIKKWLYFSAYRFDSQYVRKEGLLDKRKNDVFLKADDEFVHTIQKIAPLPLD